MATQKINIKSVLEGPNQVSLNGPSRIGKGFTSKSPDYPNFGLLNRTFDNTQTQKNTVQKPHADTVTTEKKNKNTPKRSPYPSYKNPSVLSRGTDIGPGGKLNMYGGQPPIPMAKLECSPEDIQVELITSIEAPETQLVSEQKAARPQVRSFYH